MESELSVEGRFILIRKQGRGCGRTVRERNARTFRRAEGTRRGDSPISVPSGAAKTQRQQVSVYPGPRTSEDWDPRPLSSRAQLSLQDSDPAGEGASLSFILSPLSGILHPGRCQGDCEEPGSQSAPSRVLCFPVVSHTEALGNTSPFEDVLEKVSTQTAEVRVPAAPQIPVGPQGGGTGPLLTKEQQSYPQQGRPTQRSSHLYFDSRCPLGRLYSLKNRLETKKEKEMWYVSYLVNSAVPGLASFSSDNVQGNFIFICLFYSPPYLARSPKTWWRDRHRSRHSPGAPLNCQSLHNYVICNLRN